MHFQPITTRRELSEWLDLTRRIYPTPLYVPPIRQQLVKYFEQQGDGGSTHCAFFAVRDASGAIVARTTAHSNAALDGKFGLPLQLFGFTEFIEDPAAFAALIQGLHRQASYAGRHAIFGPCNLLPNAYGGVLTAGFAQRGILDSVYNHPYYADYYRQAGFRERFASATYICDSVQSGPDATAVFGFDDGRIAGEGLEIHYAERRRFGEQIPLFHQLLNTCFAERAYYTGISLPELHERMAELVHIMDERLLMYLTRHGQPVAFAICLPDISEFLAKIDGNLNLYNQLRLLLTRRRYRRDALFVVAGVVASCRGLGYQALLQRQLFRNLRAHGYRAIRSTYVEDDNVAARTQFLKMGGRVMQRLNFFQLEVAGD
jgi:hypothetical protein